MFLFLITLVFSHSISGTWSNGRENMIIDCDEPPKLLGRYALDQWDWYDIVGSCYVGQNKSLILWNVLWMNEKQREYSGTSCHQ